MLKMAKFVTDSYKRNFLNRCFRKLLELEHIEISNHVQNLVKFLSEIVAVVAVVKRWTRAG